MADPTGESTGAALKLDFDRRLRLRFRGAVITSAVGRTRGGVLQSSRDLRAMDKRGKRRDQVDAAVMPLLRRQRRSHPASCSRLQSRQLHADAGDARDSGAVVAHEPAREADQNRREGREPWPIRHLPYVDSPLLARCFCSALIRSLASICPACWCARP